jgi:hypothetical protein
MQQTIVTAATCRDCGGRRASGGWQRLPTTGKAAMPITSVYCHVFGANVTRVIDIEGSVTRLICPAFESPTGQCRIRREGLSGGPLSQLLERVAEDTLDVRSIQCNLH